MSHSTLTDDCAAAGSPPPPASGRTWSCIRRVLPTAAVIALLAGVALWGHSSDWKLPKFSALVGNDIVDHSDWCKEHNVPEAECIECNPSLVPPAKYYGWCKEHGVAQCPLEHPDVAQLKAPAIVTPAMLERASRALTLKPRAENNSRCAVHQRRIQFASAHAVEKIGVDVAVIQERPMVEAVVTNGEVDFDQTRMAHLSSRVAGTVWRVEKQVGDRVGKGDVLALVDAGDVGRAKGEFLSAIADLRLKQTVVDRYRQLSTDGAVAGRAFQESKAAYQEARIRLQSAQQSLVNLGLPIRADDFADVETDEIAQRVHFLGLPSDMIASLDAESTTSNLLPLRSPFNGVIVDRNVVEGEVVDTSAVLFAVADVSRLWLTLNVRQEDIAFVSLGQKVLFHSSESKGEPESTGSVSWISASADEQTRTVKVRVDLPNIDGRLRANIFGTARVVLREEPAAIVVPSEAVHWDGACHVVFVRDQNYFRPDAPKFFHVRSVRLGVKDGDTTEIIAGVLPGEVIASKNSVVLAAQLLKNNLGAGCCEVHSK